MPNIFSKCAGAIRARLAKPDSQTKSLIESLARFDRMVTVNFQYPDWVETAVPSEVKLLGHRLIRLANAYGYEFGNQSLSVLCPTIRLRSTYQPLQHEIEISCSGSDSAGNLAFLLTVQVADPFIEEAQRYKAVMDQAKRVTEISDFLGYSEVVPALATKLMMLDALMALYEREKKRAEDVLASG
ncbi:hypothetical protein ACYPKM_03865 [Pseudomonas aeruginosa]